MIEGEEEVGSDNLETFVRENTDKLANDVILISDTGMLANIPSITTGLRGMSYVEVEITGRIVTCIQVFMVGQLPIRSIS